MGAYLSEPITKKISSDESGRNVAFGASSMQGWRVSQEDAHNCCIEFDEQSSLFAVYDGHGGHEVATYCAKELPSFIKNTEAYKSGNIKQALIDAFLGFDAALTKPDIVNILKEIAGTNNHDKEKQDSCCSDDEESVTDLRMEAAMPLEQVMARYQSDFEDCWQSSGRSSENTGESQSSPYLRCRREREKSGGRWAGGAGCSSSSYPWNTDKRDVSSFHDVVPGIKPKKKEEEEDVSSSSQPCSSGAASNRIEDEISKRPDRDVSLDSTTTSNGRIEDTVSPNVESTAVEAVPSTKSPDMPDSSEDVKESHVPSVVLPVNAKQQQKESPNRADVNGGAEEPKESNASNASNVEVKTVGDNVTSSSSSSGPVENGEGQIDEIISCQKRITPTPVVDLYKSLLQNDKGKKADKRNDNDNDDDDDENDETFDGLPAASDQDTEDMDDDDSSSDQLDDDDDDDDEDDDDDDDEDDEDEKEGDDDGDLTMDMTEEPGSDSGCTAVVAVLHKKNLYVANAGDSRCVICRDGEALELSLDHKPEDQPEMERIVKAGGKVTADGRVNGGLNLSRALGDHAYKQNTTLPPHEQMISALPDVRHIALEPERDEFMILACDGIWNFMSSQEVVRFIRPRLANLKDGSISKICEELFDHCLAPDTLGDGTGCDNMTAVIVKFNWSSSSSDSATTEESVTKKRPISPNTESSPLSETATSNDSTKRPKTDDV